jgi:hypothetical protein
MLLLATSLMFCSPEAACIPGVACFPVVVDGHPFGVIPAVAGVTALLAAKLVLASLQLLAFLPLVASL